MSKRMTKAAVKQAAYDETMAAHPAKLNKSKAKWIRHSWDGKTDSLRTQWQPGFFPRRSPEWHREGSLDEIEARENAGQRSLF